MLLSNLMPGNITPLNQRKDIDMEKEMLAIAKLYFANSVDTEN